MKLNWRCPFCNHDAIVHDGSEGTITQFSHGFQHGNKHGGQYVKGTVIVCPNSACLEYSINLELGGLQVVANPVGRAPVVKQILKKTWQLIPDSTARVFPSYIPQPLLADYREACLIRNLSAKASATLARRCLQGIIRDFWGVSKARLVDEIDEIHSRIDGVTWEAIDSVRKVGNIGAHMEKDINLVIDVDPKEAQLMIELIETLFEEWYVARHDRDERMKKVKNLAGIKDAARVQQPPHPPPPSSEK
jgi:hypothetical protein